MQKSRTYLGKILREARLDSGKSTGQIVEELNISRQSLSQWELGKLKPRRGKLQKISEMYDINYEVLIKAYEGTLNEETTPTFETLEDARRFINAQNSDVLYRTCLRLIDEKYMSQNDERKLEIVSDLEQIVKKYPSDQLK
jgi:transcriptional regulator with XRE-family HTH domain